MSNNMLEQNIYIIYHIPQKIFNKISNKLTA